MFQKIIAVLFTVVLLLAGQAVQHYLQQNAPQLVQHYLEQNNHDLEEEDEEETDSTSETGSCQTKQPVKFASTEDFLHMHAAEICFFQSTTMTKLKPSAQHLLYKNHTWDILTPPPNNF